MAERKRTKGQTMTYKTQHRKLKMEQHDAGVLRLFLRLHATKKGGHVCNTN